MARSKKPVIADDLLDQLLTGRDPQSVFSRDDLFDDLKRVLAERVLNAEMDHHMDGEAGDGRPNKPQRLRQEDALDRDRQAQHLCAAGSVVDEKIVSMYACGKTVREIRDHLNELDGLDVSPDLISAVTDEALDEVAEWQNRLLEPL